MLEIPRILFVCGSNSCRSQMAEGLLRARVGNRVEALSCGVTAGGVHPLAIEALAEAGHDIRHHGSKAIGDLPPGNLDLVITLCDAAREACLAPALLPAGEQQRLFAGVPAMLHWAVDDPAVVEGDHAVQLAAFRAARDELARRIDALLDDGYLAAFVRERTRLQRFADMLDDGIVIHDDHRVFFLVNRAATEITGLARERIIGRDCHEVFAPHGLCGAACQFKDGDPYPDRRRKYSTQVIGDDGVKRQLEMTTEPIEFEPGQHGVLAVIHDVTEVRELRRQLGRQRAFHGMVGVSAAVREVFETIQAVSTSDYPVLITGESGTGKELVAGAIHAESGRRGGPLVPVNCGALPENILESELFGHVRGAFTGAIRDKKGRFELADGGTLFLDEVGELPPSFQVRLLRVLQEKSFERVGGEQQITVDVRIIAATNRDLREMVNQGRFREDLFYRLCVVPIHLPPLRERREDIPPLVGQILERVSAETGKRIDGVEDSALDLLLAHAWPGNVRELINALQFAAVRCRGNAIATAHLPPEIRAAGAVGTSRLYSPSAPAAESRAATTAARNVLAFPGEGPRLDDAPASDDADGLERSARTRLTAERVERALIATGGNKVKAAKLLGVGRATLYRFFNRGS